MKNKSAIEEIQVQSGMDATQTKNGNNLPEQGSRKNFINGLLERIPSMPQFSDPDQRRVAGYIVNFMLGLLVLTLIVRGTSAATLARVDIANPTRNEIVEAITGKASVSACDTLDIFAPEGLTIEDVFVGQGQTVIVGDAVALFDMDEVQEKLTRENANLEKLLLDLEKLERTEDTDSTSLESAQRNLLRAHEDYSTVKAQGEADIASARAALEDAWDKQSDDPDASAIDTARRNLQRARDDYDTVVAQGNSDIAAAEAALNAALNNHTDSTDSTVLDSAYRNLSRAREDYNAIKIQGENDVATALTLYENAQTNQSVKQSEWENADDGDKPAAEQAYLAAQVEANNARSAYESAVNRAADNLTSAQRKIEDAEAAVTKAEQDYNRGSQQASDSRQSEIDKARDALEAAKKRAEENRTSADRKVEDAEIALRKAEQDYYKNSDQATDTLQNEIDKANDTYTSAQKKAEENLLSASRRIEDAEAALAKAEQDFGKSTQQTTDTTTQNSINAVTLRLDIEKQKSVVDILKELVSNEGILYSDLGGIVSYVKSAGSTTNQDSLVAFMDGAKGFEAYLQLDRSDAEKLVVGDDCVVTTGGGSMYYTPTVTGAISAIALPDDQDKVQVTIRLPDGDWSAGQRVDVQVVQNKSTYDLCVPLSALQSDNTGYYLLVVEEKSSVLGIENAALKVYVNIVVSDDDMVAIQGPIDRNSQVITGSNKALVAGDRVRMNSR